MSESEDMPLDLEKYVEEFTAEIELLLKNLKWELDLNEVEIKRIINNARVDFVRIVKEEYLYKKYSLLKKKVNIKKLKNEEIMELVEEGLKLCWKVFKKTGKVVDVVICRKENKYYWIRPDANVAKVYEPKEPIAPKEMIGLMIFDHRSLDGSYDFKNVYVEFKGIVESPLVLEKYLIEELIELLESLGMARWL